MWDLTDNKLTFLDSEQAEMATLSGELPAALMGLSLGIAVDNNELGEAGEILRTAKRMVIEAKELSERAFTMLRDNV
jgi:hypothetical protein